ncbi:3-oxoacyl-ACP reductase [Leucobacter ruminantium]
MSDPSMPDPVEKPAIAMPTSQPVLMRALRWGLVVTAVLVAAFAGIGWLVSGAPGLIGGVIGTAMGGFFLVLTVGSIAFANRFIESPSYLALFFAIVLGSWILKFVIFIVTSLLLRDQPWLDPVILFIGIVAAVLVSLVIDAVVIAKSRIPVIGGVGE